MFTTRIVAHSLRKKKENTLCARILIFGALTHVTNRYQLCQLAAKATRKLHKPNTRLQDTTNEVLDRFKETVPMDDGVEPTVEKIHERSAGAPRGLGPRQLHLSS